MATLPFFTRLEIMKTTAAAVRSYHCHAIKRLFVMDSFGNIYPCEMLKVNLGNLRDCGYALRGLLQSTVVKELLKSIRVKECNCTWECAIQNSLVFNVWKYPAMIRHAFFR
jgi:radical SAM protein with 4Fe4S-binding SPASM domain